MIKKVQELRAGDRTPDYEVLEDAEPVPEEDEASASRNMWRAHVRHPADDVPDQYVYGREDLEIEVLEEGS